MCQDTKTDLELGYTKNKNLETNNEASICKNNKFVQKDLLLKANLSGLTSVFKLFAQAMEPLVNYSNGDGMTFHI